MKIKMELLSDAIFGNGMSVPGGEDISVLRDMYGFPYYKGSTFKGVFREELYRYLEWTQNPNPKKEVDRLLGFGGDDNVLNNDKIVFSDFCISDKVKDIVLAEIGENQPDQVLDACTHLRTFTSISEDGSVKEGTLRIGRCIDKGLCFYSELNCQKKDEELVIEVLKLIKWIGTMRNRGFGKVKITIVKE